MWIILDIEALIKFEKAKIDYFLSNLLARISKMLIKSRLVSKSAFCIFG
jgi:hypothetical protein